MGFGIYCAPQRRCEIATNISNLNANDATSYLELAQAVVDAGAVPLLVLCVQEPELSLKRISASALSDISKHSPEVWSFHMSRQRNAINLLISSPNQSLMRRPSLT